MDDAPVGGREAAAEALACQLAYHAGEAARQLGPGHGAGARSGEAADRIDAGAQLDRRRRNFPVLHQRGEGLHDIARRWAEIEIDGDTGIEFDPVQHAGERDRRRVKAIAIGIDRSGHDQGQPGGAVLQILQRLRVGGFRVGMIDPLHHRPGRARCAPGDRRRPRRARIERVDAQSVIGLADQTLLERGALERGIDQLAPVRLAGGREFGGEGKRLIKVLGHRRKVP